MNASTLTAVLKTDFRRTFKPFARALCLLWAAALLLFAAPLFGGEAGAPAPAVLALSSLAAFVAVLLFIAAVFRLYHGLLFKDADYLTALPAATPLQLTLAKIIVAGVWLLPFLGGGFAAAIYRLEAAREIFGTGIMSVYSLLSLLLQALFLIVVLFLACTACHLSFFQTYKTLAGIFLLVAVYYVESDVILFLKRNLFSIFGGVQTLNAGDLLTALGTAAVVDAVCYALLTALNIFCILKALRSVLPETKSRAERTAKAAKSGVALPPLRLKNQ